MRTAFLCDVVLNQADRAGLACTLTRAYQGTFSRSHYSTKTRKVQPACCAFPTELDLQRLLYYTTPGQGRLLPGASVMT
jgi:hypothetical protein